MKSRTVCIWALLTIALTYADTNYVLKSNAQFTQNMYKSLLKERGNFIFSPLSVHSVLSMLYQGAGERTKIDLAVNLYLPDPLKTAEKYYQVLQHLNDTSDVNVALVNKLYLDRNQRLKAEFFSTIRQNFLSTIELVDFSKRQQTANEINRWVEDRTNQKIQNLCEPRDFNSETALVAINTLYFKGEWGIGRVHLNRNKKYEFHLEGGETSRVNMMTFHSSLNFKDDETIGAKVLEMPFKDERFSVVFVLPNERGSLTQLEERLSERKPYDVDIRTGLVEEVYDLVHVFANLSKRRVRVRIPPFKIEKVINLEGILRELGLGNLFDQGECNLSGISDSPHPLFVSKMIQKVVINVNENGCEAATASSGFSLAPVSLIDCDFVADHPFFFSLIERSSDGVNILFTGRMSNPLQEIEENASPPSQRPDLRVHFPRQPQASPSTDLYADIATPTPIVWKLFSADVND